MSSVQPHRVITPCHHSFVRLAEMLEFFFHFSSFFSFVNSLGLDLLFAKLIPISRTSSKIHTSQSTQKCAKLFFAMLVRVATSKSQFMTGYPHEIIIFFEVAALKIRVPSGILAIKLLLLVIESWKVMGLAQVRYSCLGEGRDRKGNPRIHIKFLCVFSGNSVVLACSS